jgi:hypothetical protein
LKWSDTVFVNGAEPEYRPGDIKFIAYCSDRAPF